MTPCHSSRSGNLLLDIVCLFAEAWPQSVTPANLMAGFRKCWIYPLNTGPITDRHMAPPKVFLSQNKSNKTTTAESCSPVSESPKSLSEQASVTSILQGGTRNTFTS